MKSKMVLSQIVELIASIRVSDVTNYIRPISAIAANKHPHSIFVFAKGAQVFISRDMTFFESVTVDYIAQVKMISSIYACNELKGDRDVIDSGVAFDCVCGIAQGVRVMGFF